MGQRTFRWQGQEAGNLEAAPVDPPAAGHGLSTLSGERSPTVRVVRAVGANVLNERGHGAEALVLPGLVRLMAGQACTLDSGSGTVPEAIPARIRLRRLEEGAKLGREALIAMRPACVSNGESSHSTSSRATRTGSVHEICDHCSGVSRVVC